MNLKEALLRGIYGYGFEKPSAIQQRAIMPCIEGEVCEVKIFLSYIENLEYVRFNKLP